MRASVTAGTRFAFTWVPWEWGPVEIDAARLKCTLDDQEVGWVVVGRLWPRHTVRVGTDAHAVLERHQRVVGLAYSVTRQQHDGEAQPVGRCAWGPGRSHRKAHGWVSAGRGEMADRVWRMHACTRHRASLASFRGFWCNSGGVSACQGMKQLTRCRQVGEVCNIFDDLPVRPHRVDVLWATHAAPTWRAR